MSVREYQPVEERNYNIEIETVEKSISNLDKTKAGYEKDLQRIHAIVFPLLPKPDPQVYNQIKQHIQTLTTFIAQNIQREKELARIARESTDNYTCFFMVSGNKIMVSKTIKHFEELLSEHNFFRVHQSHLINLTHIKKYFKGEGGYVIMSDDSSVIVSRRKKEAFLKKFFKLT